MTLFPSPFEEDKWMKHSWLASSCPLLTFKPSLKVAITEKLQK